MRYMARVMREALVKKFPDAPEKEVLKVTLTCLVNMTQVLTGVIFS